ncbi:hypothetical protein [Campylobacter pinnipediorum]|uniref:hypothetical protein n=1 Tax=Campylobacter pinnipediorum TaxID=1965231 RepID=UPI000994A666|nr:hypothetical protein [Campylobacter pinnipediorum]AQW82875.1 hypothetical protein CPIN17261_0865 [Campylobacter pinnipediorum subsp. pinnipediorum]
MIDYEFSSGIDSYEFILPKKTLMSFLKKLELIKKLRLVSRNKSVKEYADYKYKSKEAKKDESRQAKKDEDKTPMKIRYISFKRGIKSLTNSMLVIEYTDELKKLCKKRKKRDGYYVSVVFAGLYQPSREVHKETYKILGKFLRRFKTYSYDFAADFKGGGEISYKMKEFFKKATEKYTDGNVTSKSTSLYANNCDDKFYGLSRILLYDKYKKQTNYHKQKIDNSFDGWQRLELTFKLNKKFLDEVENKSYQESIAVMDEIISNISDDFPFGVDLAKLNEQIAFFKDMRKRLSLKRMIF